METQKDLETLKEEQHITESALELDPLPVDRSYSPGNTPLEFMIGLTPTESNQQVEDFKELMEGNVPKVHSMSNLSASLHEKPAREQGEASPGKKMLPQRLVSPTSSTQSPKPVYLDLELLKGTESPSIVQHMLGSGLSAIGTEQMDVHARRLLSPSGTIQRAFQTDDRGFKGGIPLSPGQGSAAMDSPGKERVRMNPALTESNPPRKNLTLPKIGSWGSHDESDIGAGSDIQEEVALNTVPQVVQDAQVRQSPFDRLTSVDERLMHFAFQTTDGLDSSGSLPQESLHQAKGSKASDLEDVKTIESVISTNRESTKPKAAPGLRTSQSRTVLQPKERTASTQAKKPSVPVTRPSTKPEIQKKPEVSAQAAQKEPKPAVPKRGASKTAVLEREKNAQEDKKKPGPAMSTQPQPRSKVESQASVRGSSKAQSKPSSLAGSTMDIQERKLPTPMPTGLMLPSRRDSRVMTPVELKAGVSSLDLGDASPDVSIEKETVKSTKNNTKEKTKPAVPKMSSSKPTATSSQPGANTEKPLSLKKPAGGPTKETASTKPAVPKRK